MDTQQLVNDLEEAARIAGIPIAKVCKRLKVHRATWQRWKSGEFQPRMVQYQQLSKVHLEMVNGR